MTQSESDFFLSQIVQAWVIDFDAPQFARIRIDGPYLVLPDGMLAPPFGKNDPWDMYAMVRNWPEIEAYGFDATFRRMWEFYLAYSEAGFASGYLDVAQLQLTRRGR